MTLSRPVLAATMSFVAALFSVACPPDAGGPPADTTDAGSTPVVDLPASLAAYCRHTQTCTPKPHGDSEQACVDSWESSGFYPGPPGCTMSIAPMAKLLDCLTAEQACGPVGSQKSSVPQACWDEWELWEAAVGGCFDAGAGGEGEGEGEPACQAFLGIGDGCDCGCVGRHDTDCDSVGGGCDPTGCFAAECAYCYDAQGDQTTCPSG